MKKLGFFLAAIVMFVMLTANTIFAAEQGLNATFVKFDLGKDDFVALLEDGITPEELFEDYVAYDVKLVDDTAFYIEDPDCKQKGVEILEDTNGGNEAPEQWGIYWEGTLIPAESGKYSFHLISDNGFLLKIDGQTVVDFWVDDWDKEIDGEVTLDLEAGKKYRIEAWWFDNWGGSYYKLTWKKDDGEFTKIPLSVLSTELQPKPSPTPKPTPSPTPTKTPTPPKSPSSSAPASATPQSTPTGGNTGNTPSPIIFVGIAAAVIIIGVVVFLVISKKKKA